MASSSVIKLALIGAGTAGIIGGASFAIHQKLSEEKEVLISSLLEKNGKELIKEGENEVWKQKWDAFKAKYKEIKTRWEITDLNTEETTTPKSFKNKCVENSNKKVKNKDDLLYKEVEEYCSKAKAVTTE